MTNNAVQKQSDNYGQFEDGNQMSFNDFQAYIDENYSESAINVKNDLVTSMKETVVTTFKAAENWLLKDNRRSTFELFGYDFIIDEDFKVWLIEINTNPCLEESSKLLESLIPRMVDDGFKLTLDQIFKKKSKPKPAKSPESQDPDQITSISNFPVSGYDDTENLWDLIL